MSNPYPPHGSLSRYLRHHCQCDPCRDAHTRHHTLWKYQRAQGIVFRVDAQNVRAHILYLLSQGMSPSLIAAKAGLTTSRITTIAYGRPKSGLPPPRQINPNQAEAILRVRVELLALPGGRISSLTARRCIQALAYLGITHRQIAAGTGLSLGIIDRLSSEHASLTLQAHQQIRAYYNQTKDRSIELNQTHHRAVRQGFAPPWAWDDRTIDDPDGQPDHTVPPPAHALYHLRRNYLTASPTSLVDAEPVRAHIRSLFPGLPVNIGLIAWCTGISHSTLRMIVFGKKGSWPPLQIQASIAKILLQTTLDLPILTPTGLVDATASRRRLQACKWMGWPPRHNASALNITPTYLHGILSGQVPYIGYRTHQRIKDLYIAQSRQTGPSLIDRQQAITAAYVPYLAWDGISLYDPQALPDWGVEISPQTLQYDLTRAQIRFLCLTGASLRQAAEILQCQTSYLHLSACALNLVFPDN